MLACSLAYLPAHLLIFFFCTSIFSRACNKSFGQACLLSPFCGCGCVVCMNKCCGGAPDMCCELTRCCVSSSLILHILIQQNRACVYAGGRVEAGRPGGRGYPTAALARGRILVQPCTCPLLPVTTHRELSPLILNAVRSYLFVDRYAALAKFSFAAPPRTS